MMASDCGRFASIRVHLRKKRIRLSRLPAPHADTRSRGNVSYRPGYPICAPAGPTTRITRPGDPNRRRRRKASTTTGGTLLVLALALLVSLLVSFRGLQAQPPQADSPAPGKPGYLPSPAVTPDMIESRSKEIASAADLNEATKTRLSELYRKALGSLEAAETYQARTATFVEALETAPEQTEEIRRRLEASAPEPAIEPLPAGRPVKELEQRLTKYRADTAAVEAKLGELEQKLATWSQRPAQLRDRITAAKIELERLDAENGLPLSQEEPPLLTEARRWALQARRRELRAELHMLDQDLLSHAAREALLKARRDVSTHELALLRTRQHQLEEQLDRHRHQEAEQARVAAEAAQREVAGKHPLLEDLAARNAQLTGELSEFIAAHDGIHTRQAQVVAETERLGDELRNTRRRLEIGGLTQTLGQILFDRRQKLPDQRPYRREAKEREQAIAAAMLKQIRYDEEVLRLRDPDTFVATLTMDHEGPLPSDLRDELRELAQVRASLLTKVIAATDTYLRALGDLDYASSRLIETIADYDDYLATHLLWVRSAPPVSPATLKVLPGAIAWFFSPDNWLQVAQVLVREVTSPSLLWLLLLGLLLLRWRTRAIRAAILATAHPLRWVSTDRTRLTLKALGSTLLLAAPWPLLLVLLGWRLDASLEATPFTKAIGHGALEVAFALFSLRAFRLLCIPGGVADRHFGWSRRALRTIRRHFDWVIWFLVPVGFVVHTTHSYWHATYSDSLEQIALLVVMVGTALFIMFLSHPKRGVLSAYLAANPKGCISRLSPLWYPLIVAMPPVLAVLTLLGYVHTAGTLMRSLVAELWLILGLTVIQQLSVRWLTLSRQRLTLSAAGERPAAPGKTARQGDPPHLGPVPPVAEPEVNLAVLDTRTQTLVNSLVLVAAVVGLWGIYSDVLPALAVFEDISLWTYTGTLDGQEHVIPVTLADLGLTLLITITAAVAVRNLPAFLEIALLQRIAISAGIRYTVKTLTGYIIVIAAASIIFSTFGLSWSQIQWLVAALGVGIGFGLQEIVANFISGLIILFERPVRVGDIVTIGNTTGVVSQIRIRATIVRSWDQQELLVPNKALITGHLTNWTLSDRMNRIVITVGVNYAADIPQALDRLRAVVEENEQILMDPKPLITFEGFGGNALTLVLRCYLDSPEHRLAVISRLHQSIHQEFRAAGIAITGEAQKAREG